MLGVGKRVERAHRLAHEHGPLEPKVLDQPLQVPDVGLGAIVEARGPFAVAVPALIEREAVCGGAQRQADEVPGMGREAAAVQEEDD